MKNETLNWFTQEIMDEFHIPESRAKDYAQNAINSLDAHGGGSSDRFMLRKVMRVVVKKWIDSEL